MISVTRKWWLVPLLLCLVPSSFALKPDAGRPGHHKCKPSEHCQQLPEGGSAAIYLLGAGLACLGAVFIRSRASRRNLS